MRHANEVVHSLAWVTKLLCVESVLRSSFFRSFGTWCFGLRYLACPKDHLWNRVTRITFFLIGITHLPCKNRKQIAQPIKDQKEGTRRSC